MCSTSVFKIVYGIFFNLSLDYSLILYTEYKAAVAKKFQEVAKGKQLSSLLFPRFLGLLLRPALDDNNIDVGRLPAHKVNVLTQYRPTVNKEGYEAERPIPKRLMSYMKSKEIRRVYRRIRETLGPVSRTSLRIETTEEEERTEDTSRPQAEGETVRAGKERMRVEEKRVSVQQEREKERKREEARKKKAEREKKEVERAEQERLAELAHARAEEERAEKARQAEIARLREEARLRAEEEARQTLAHSSSPNQGDDREHYDDAARSYTSEESEEEEEEILRAESMTNASHKNTLMELTAHNIETLQQVVASIQRVEASTSHGTQALIPLSVHMDYVTQSAMKALGDRLLQKVEDFTTDFNSKATKAAKDINDTLVRLNYRSDDEMRKVGVAVDELLKVIEEMIKLIPRAEDERPKRQRDPSSCTEPSTRRRLDDDEDPDESRPQNRQEGENFPTTILSTNVLCPTPTSSKTFKAEQTKPTSIRQRRGTL
ncbi:histone-lysine N-methyltransferase, H3 lysine-79 specific-like [Cynara cardunculus var. scolymus]|uniref:histone-lysine N-methyltransferase, H3 lysine-79 specific-like n=1 Tax=Cynara cardunculus var. scolymus TaxID=59895 RepID=UPI000D62BF0B|nr:histone-lysine N-methyltransferase, H3 lysine-79 specific-like [Cynara cardunculus var. scolymus]